MHYEAPYNWRGTIYKIKWLDRFHEKQVIVYYRAGLLKADKDMFGAVPNFVMNEIAGFEVGLPLILIARIVDDYIDLDDCMIGECNSAEDGLEVVKSWRIFSNKKLDNKLMGDISRANH